MLSLARTTALATALCLSAPAQASFFDTYGFSARAVGRGGSMVALGFDYDAAYYNPANVLSRKRVHLGFGLDLVVPRLDIDVLAGTFETRTPDDNLGMHLGVSTPIGGIFDEVLGFGLAFFHPLTAGTSVTSTDPADAYWYRYDNLPDKLILAAALAVEPVSWLRLGAGAQLLAAIDGEVTGALSLAEGRFLSESIDIEVVPRIAPTLGLALGPFSALPGLRFGATYRGALELDYRLPVQIDIEQLGLLEVLVEGVSLYTPHQLAIGLGWESSIAPEPGLSLEANLTWEHWSKAPPAGALFHLSIDERNVRPPTDPQDLPVDFIDVRSAPIPLGAVDTLSPRIGLEWRPSENLSRRGGYAFRPTPLPRPIYRTNAMDADAHVASLGVGITFGDPLGAETSPLSLDLAAQWTYLPARRIDKDPAAGDPQGAYLGGGQVWHLSLDLRHDHF